MTLLILFKKYIETRITRLQRDIWYSLIIVVLAVLSMVMLGYEFLPNPHPDRVLLFQRLDLVIAYIFLADFFLGLVFNTEYSRKEFLRHNWLNLVSSIPITSEMTRALRILRVYRAVRVIRAGVNVYFAKQRLNQIQKENHS